MVNCEDTMGFAYERKSFYSAYTHVLRPNIRRCMLS